ncbi:MAG: hypothetical protein KAJ58_02715 [Candidatus Pacebacteria bacterium]|nr:hypothetical protein [Candidatus Paceibacterota bacterium]
MTVLCAWCKKEIGEEKPCSNGTVTHGICKECAKKVREEIDSFFEERKKDNSPTS